MLLIYLIFTDPFLGGFGGEKIIRVIRKISIIRCYKNNKGDKMRIVFTSTGEGWDATIDPRFGRTDYIVVYDDASEELSCIDNRQIVQVAHGAGPLTAQKIHELKADILITGNGPGGNAASVLSHTNLTIYIGAGGLSIKEAYDAFKQGNLKQGDNNA